MVLLKGKAMRFVTRADVTAEGVTLGPRFVTGRESENLVIGEASTGAASDLSGATDLAVRMVRDWGLSPRLGPIGYGSDQASFLSGPQSGERRPFAEGTQQIIDQEVSRLLSEAEDRARGVLAEHRDLLDAIVAERLEKEAISGGDLAGIVGRVRRADREVTAGAASTGARVASPN